MKSDQQGVNSVPFFEWTEREDGSGVATYNFGRHPVLVSIESAAQAAHLASAIETELAERDARIAELEAAHSARLASESDRLRPAIDWFANNYPHLADPAVGILTFYADMHPIPAQQPAVAEGWITRLYNTGYHAGHHHTVEGAYTHVYPVDMDTYHSDLVSEWLEDNPDALPSAQQPAPSLWQYTDADGEQAYTHIKARALEHDAHPVGYCRVAAQAADGEGQ